MIFNSLTFIVFFALVLALHNVPVLVDQKKINLLVASYLFYAAWNPPFVILLWISTVVDWWAAQGWSRRSEPARAARVDAAVGGGEPRHARLLQVRRLPDGELRRADGVARRRLPAAARSTSCCRSASRSTPSPRCPTRSTSTCAAPKPASNFLDYALFVTFFPHLVAGPIMRPTELVPQFAHARRATADHCASGWR